MEKKIFQSKKLPSTKAPYSQAIIYEPFIFVSGQVAFDPEKKSVVKGTIEDETELALNNLKTILEEAGSSLEKVLKVTVFLTDMEEFQRFNEIYKKFFCEEPPARSCVEVKSLPFNAKVEIEAIAYL